VVAITNPKTQNRRPVSKAKGAVFVVALVVLILNFALLLVGKLSTIEFWGIILVVAVGANAAFSLINRRARNQQAKEKK